MLDVFLIDHESTGVSRHGTPLRFDAPAYGGMQRDGLRIIRPYEEHQIENAHEAAPSFPPSNWDPNDPEEWPFWRNDVWHEVVHRVEDEKFHYYDDGADCHPARPFWRAALTEIAMTFSVAATKLGRRHSVK